MGAKEECQVQKGFMHLAALGPGPQFFSFWGFAARFSGEAECFICFGGSPTVSSEAFKRLLPWTNFIVQ